MPTLLELLLLAIHVRLLVAWNFDSIPMLDVVADLAIPMILLPAICVVGGRYTPYIVALPVMLTPIAGKTFKAMCMGEVPSTPWQVGLDLYLIGPLLVALAVALFLVWHTRHREAANWFAPMALFFAVWLVFYLNDVFFESPWIWQDWTSRTANGFLFFVCAVFLSIAAVWYSPAASD